MDHSKVSTGKNSKSIKTKEEKKAPVAKAPAKAGTVAQAQEGVSANVASAKESVSKASDAISAVIKGNGNIKDAAFAAKGAMDAVTGLPGRISESLMLPIMTKLAAFKGQAFLPAGKQMDPVLGIDVHMVMFPPVPAPVPLPHPYIGMLFRPKDFVSIAVNTFKQEIIAGVSDAASNAGGDTAKKYALNDAQKDMAFSIVMAAVGLSASIKFGSFIPRAVTGTPSKNIPHFPMGPVFHPAFMAAVKKNHGKAFLGSLFVAADGDPMVGMFHLHYDCWDIGIIDLFKSRRAGHKKAPDPSGPQLELVVPSGTVMAIPWGRPVLVNSIPTPINPLGIVNRLFKAGLGKLAKMARKGTQKALNKLTGKVPCNILTRVSKMAGTGQSHPVDVSGGFFYTDNEDFNIPGPIPLVWERTWYNNSTYQGALGHGWHHSYDMALGVDADSQQAIMRLSDGRAATFAIPVNVNEPSYNRKEKLQLHLHQDGFYFVTDEDHLIYRFSDTPFTKTGTQQEQHLITSVANTNGFAIRFAYNKKGGLTHITDSASRILQVDTDAQQRITAIHAPHATEKNKTVVIASYAYDDAGNMIAHKDALEQAETFDYQKHLMVSETWRNGLHWQFKYNGTDHTSKCIEVIGDDDLLHYHFDYTNPNCTKVTNSLGHEKLFYHKDGLVTKYVDPNGEPWQNYYNKHGDLEHTANPLNHKTAYTHDAFGNVATVTEPDGLFTHTMYINKAYPHLPTHATDERGGQWYWQYDTQGNLVKRINPLGAITEYAYKDGLLDTIKDAIGATTTIQYDKHYNVDSITAPNGAVTSYKYDALGQCTTIINPNNAKQTRVFDILGRVTNVQDFDGNTIQLNYDAIDNVIRYQDKYKDVAYTYSGIKKLRSRTEAGATLSFLYDTEEQLTKITNQHGLPYTFMLDPAGNVIKETGFDGVERSFIRNAAGLTTKIERPGNRFTAYTYDMGDRISQVTYHDDSTEQYEYALGALTKATNQHAEVVFERDVMGNIMSEASNEHTITSQLDILQRRTNISSSLGANIALEMDMLDNITSMKAGGWQALMQYDSLGLETLRQCTGGISSQWQRDKIGRVKTHTVGDAKKPTPNSRKDYSWDVGDQLKKITDSKKGNTHFDYDVWGNLSSAAYADGTTQQRCPDAVGNLFERQDRQDRKYDKGGKLLKTRNAEYKYDVEGNLIEKITSEGSFYYHWNGAGMLEKVTRPDKTEVFFKYDALGRRIEKQYKKTITKYVWDGNKPLHEWKEFDAKESTADDMITWIFEEDSFAPAAKIKGTKKYSIVTDHLGTPTQGYAEDGKLIWDRELDSYGKIRMVKGEEGFCNYLYQGQTLDAETGLCYSRHRYYAPEEGIFISKDPISIEGGYNVYAYVHDPNSYIDPFGLASYHKKNGQFGKKRGRPKKPNDQHGNSVHSKKPRQHYVIVDDQGRVYHGVGDVKGNRAKQSKKRLEGENPDRTFSIESQTNHSTSKGALKGEAQGIKDTGGTNSSGNYNIQTSPGAPFI